MNLMDPGGAVGYHYEAKHIKYQPEKQYIQQALLGAKIVEIKRQFNLNIHAVSIYQTGTIQQMASLLKYKGSCYSSGTITHTLLSALVMKSES